MANQPSCPVQLNVLQKQLLNDFQKKFPLSPTPFAEIATRLQVTEEAVLEALAELSQAEMISRVGAVMRPHRLGVSTLAAMAVPEELIATVADVVSSLPEVNHNYEREHKFNLWFVITATTEAHLQVVIREIENHTGLGVMSLPMLENYHVDLSFDLKWQTN